MEYNQIIQNGGSKMADAFLAINDIIMASPLLLEIIYMLPTSCFYQTPYYLSIFRFTPTLIEENLDSANKFNNIMS